MKILCLRGDVCFNFALSSILYPFKRKQSWGFFFEILLISFYIIVFLTGQDPTYFHFLTISIKNTISSAQHFYFVADDTLSQE